jgi:chromosome partitioning protein
MAKVVSLINMKGGVGKSTLTVNLAWHYACFDKWSLRVLVVDLDPQFNASQYLVGAQRYREFLSDGKPTVWDILEQYTTTPAGKVDPFDPHQAVRKVRTFDWRGGAIDLIPSRLELAFSLRNPAEKEYRLQKCIMNLRDEYDLIVIDCPPTESPLTTAAYLSSDYVLVPVKPEYLSTIGLSLLVNSMAEFGRQHEDHDLQLAGIVFNGTSDYSPEETLSKEEVKSLAGKHGWHVFSCEIPYSRSYPKGAREGRPIFLTSNARRKPKLLSHSFADEFASRIGL